MCAQVSFKDTKQNLNPQLQQQNNQIFKYACNYLANLILKYHIKIIIYPLQPLSAIICKNAVLT